MKMISAFEITTLVTIFAVMLLASVDWDEPVSRYSTAHAYPSTSTAHILPCN